MSQMTFEAFMLSEEMRRAIAELGYEAATDIQAAAIPLIREGRDVIGRSQTGTGKTIAFGIPAIEAVETEAEGREAQVLILCPTRELAMQAADELRKLAKYTEGIRIAEVFGGAPMDRQIFKLKRANIVVGTPGRIMDHMRRKTLRLSALKMIVLDEADEMLSMGFREDIETILQDAPEDRQTILFSATMPPAILRLTKKFQRDPQLIAVNAAQVTVENIEQLYYMVPAAKKPEALQVLLQYHHVRRAIVFVNTKREADEVTEFLNDAEIQARAIHGDMKQPQRTKVMGDFKDGKTAVLVATDVAARGIDVSGIDFVVNYDVPQNPEYYVHRIGRTGRAGKSGTAITMCCGKPQINALLQMVKTVKSTISQQAFPNAEALKAARRKRSCETIEAAISAGRFDYLDLMDELCEKGYAQRDIAAAALQLYLGVPQKEPELIPEPCGHSGRTCKIRLSIGKSSQILPGHIVGALTERTGLTGKDIGKIEIFQDYSLVAIPESALQMVLSDLRGLKICGSNVSAALYSEVSLCAHKKDKTAKRRAGKRPDGRRPVMKKEKERETKILTDQ